MANIIYWIYGMKKIVKLKVCILLCIIAVILNLPLPVSVRVKQVGQNTISPFLNVMSYVIYRVKDSFNVVVNLKRIQEQSLLMLEENVNLRDQIFRYEYIEIENERLRELLDLQKNSVHKLILCEVTARNDSYGWWRTIVLNKGSAEGLRLGMAVISKNGLVGKISQISDFSSEVLLLSDPICRVPCKIAGADSLGIVQGGGSSNWRKIDLDMFAPVYPFKLEYLEKDLAINKGEEVVTSGLGGLFPEGLLIGVIDRIRMDDSQLYQVAHVTPAADLANLRYVFAVDIGE